MSKTAIVYWSGSGNTEAMANVLADAVKAAGGEADVYFVSDFDADKVDDYDDFAFGCSAWGSEELEANEFLPVYEEVEPKLSGKKVGLFGSYGHGEGAYQQDWQQRAEEAGAQVVGRVAALDAPDDEAEAALADLAAKLVG